MQTSDIIKLVSAGFTKEEIIQLASPTQPQVQTPTLVQPLVQPQVQAQTLVQPQVQTPTLVQSQVQTPPNVDYKMLYETQKKMLEDMQTLNLTGTKGAPIDSPLSVVNDFLGGEK